MVEQESNNSAREVLHASVSLPLQMAPSDARIEHFIRIPASLS